MIIYPVAQILLTCILSCIFSIHFYWFLGGEKGLDASLPHDINSIKKRLSNTSIRMLNALLIFPILLVLITLIISIHSENSILTPFQQQIHLYASILFILRGLFGWVLTRFSKKPDFKRNNTYIFSPLSLLIGFLFLSLIFFNSH
ncbi:hypothetical protein DID78_07145 [Candidatus Marinamargulisbacteria bacterium SCGC AG-343-D04]|nr:hypothetical protein DID78_07145 [Candidatus Marinamargulisbacteria bacterium SCGC AG-343-D04]